MKDNEKVELTAGDLRRAAEKCGTAKEVLKTLCPEVFKESPPEWEDITERCSLRHFCGELCIATPERHYPFAIGELRPAIGMNGSLDGLVYSDSEYGAFRDRIWRRK